MREESATALKDLTEALRDHIKGQGQA
jgi:hypothetical protein